MFVIFPLCIIPSIISDLYHSFCALSIHLLSLFLGRFVVVLFIHFLFFIIPLSIPFSFICPFGTRVYMTAVDVSFLKTRRRVMSRIILHF